MPFATIPLTSFTGGEWSNRLHGRVDIEKYINSCEILQNMIIYPHGGVTRRMGLEYIGDAKLADVRLIPFEYNREQAYVLEFGHNYIRYFRNGAQIEDSPGVPKETATPYTTAELSELAFTQSADVLYLVHPNHAPRKLTRSGADIFALNAAVLAGGVSDGPAIWASDSAYPRSVTFYQSRLVFGGTSKKPMTIWFSKSFLFDDFTSGSAGSDAFSITLTSKQVNAVQWLETSKRLQVGTTGGEWTIYPPSGQALTIANLQADRESNYGSKSGRVQLIGTEVLYSSRDGKKLRTMGYDYQSDGYVSPELSILSEHLTRPGIKEFDFAQNPDGILWTVMNDGSFAGLTYLKSQQVQGWHRHSTDGIVLSVCTIEGDSSSETWFAVSRNGGTRIERMAEPFEGDTPNDIGCAYLDSFLTYEGAPATVFSGLEHLNTKTVSVLADGVYVGDFVVDGGSITIEKAASNVIVGLKYQWELMPLRLEGGSPLGFSQGKKKRIEELIVRLERSAGIKHTIPGIDDEFDLINRAYGENYDTAIPLTSEDVVLQMGASWDREGQFKLFGNEPFPATILMISAKVVVNE